MEEHIPYKPIIAKCCGCSQVTIRGKDVARLKLSLKNPACCKKYINPAEQWKHHNCLGATFMFRLKLEGPSGSGKSTFIKFIMEMCYQSKGWTVEKKGPHSLAITGIRPLILNKSLDNSEGERWRERNLTAMKFD